MVVKDQTLEARGLGDSALYQSYFVCIMDKGNQVTLSYGIAKETMVCLLFLTIIIMYIYMNIKYCVYLLFITSIMLRYDHNLYSVMDRVSG